MGEIMTQAYWKVKHECDELRRCVKRLEKANDRAEKHLDTCLRIMLKYPQTGKKRKEKT